VPKHIERGNLRKSKVRARVEHVCGGIKQGAAKQFIRSIDLPKATLRVGLKNMAHNIKRLSHLLSHVPPMHRTAWQCLNAGFWWKNHQSQPQILVKPWFATASKRTGTTKSEPVNGYAG
jgi:hypothetical protein